MSDARSFSRLHGDHPIRPGRTVDAVRPVLALGPVVGEPLHGSIKSTNSDVRARAQGTQLLAIRKHATAYCLALES